MLTLCMQGAHARQGWNAQMRNRESTRQNARGSSHSEPKHVTKKNYEGWPGPDQVRHRASTTAKAHGSLRSEPKNKHCPSDQALLQSGEQEKPMRRAASALRTPCCTQHHFHVALSAAPSCDCGEAPLAASSCNRRRAPARATALQSCSEARPPL